MSHEFCKQIFLCHLTQPVNTINLDFYQIFERRPIEKRSWQNKKGVEPASETDAEIKLEFVWVNKEKVLVVHWTLYTYGSD